MADNDTIVLDQDGKEVNPKETNPFKRFIFTFINDDPQSIKEKIINDYVVPGVIDLVRLTAHGTIDAIFDKGSRPLPMSSYGKTASSYKQAWDKQNKNRTNSPSQGVLDKYSSLSAIPFDDRGKAEMALYMLKDTIKKSDTGTVDVGYFLDLADKPHVYTDCEHGWTNLDMVYVTQRGGKYYLANLPYPQDIKNAPIIK